MQRLTILRLGHASLVNPGPLSCPWLSRDFGSRLPKKHNLLGDDMKRFDTKMPVIVSEYHIAEATTDRHKASVVRHWKHRRPFECMWSNTVDWDDRPHRLVICILSLLVGSD